MLTRTILTTVIVSLTLANAHRAGGDVARPTPHELAAIAAAEGERLWFHEEEFRRDPLLRARPHQVVILHLEPGAKGGKPIRNTIPYLFAETATFNFCVPKKDPHIRSLKLIREGSDDVVVHAQRGEPCKPQTIAAGLYRLVVEHDAKGIGPDGKKAFVHLPRFRSATLASSASGSFACNALSVLMTPNGRFVTQGSGTPYGVVQTQAGSVDLRTGGWQICRDGNGAYELYLTGLNPTALQQNTYGDHAIYSETDSHLTVHNNSSLPYASPYDLTDLGDFQFTMATSVFQGGQAYPANPIVVGSDNLLHWTTSGAPTTFTIPVKYYVPGTTVPPLEKGEVAFFQGCNANNSMGTWVVRANLSDVTGIVYNNPLNTYQDSLSIAAVGAAIQLGPETIVSLYGLKDYRGTGITIGADIGCANNLSYFSSIKIAPARDFVAATDQCLYCNLSGVDLSGLDLSGGAFSWSTFTGANLNNTNLQQANVSSANFPGTSTLLTGTNFVDAFPSFANFRGADLSQANFQTTSGLVVREDFTDRPDLTTAILDVQTFSPSDWRWLNLTGATINSVAGATLSTVVNPLDLSGALLNSVSLSGAILDGANLGCATIADGSFVCTQLYKTSLTSASLKHTILEHANLNNAYLNNANLDGATLCGANLNAQDPTHDVSATLEGAFLRNVNLYQADLTSVDLSYASFYSTGLAGSCPAACGFTPSCASAVDATMDKADFTGAYLAGADFSGSGSSLKAAIFSNAILMGSNFSGANLSEDGGFSTKFTGAWLQGVDFTDATITGANFADALVDIDPESVGVRAQVQLCSQSVAFAGDYTPSSGSILGCVEFTTDGPTETPETDNSNECPDHSIGPCLNATQWQPKLLSTNCPNVAASCTHSTHDKNWNSAN